MSAAPPRATPPPLIERVLGPFERFVARESSSGLVLLACTALAMACANSPWAAGYEHIWQQSLSLTAGPFVARATLHAFVNDGLMAVFFFLVGLEIKREILVGELASLRRAALPLAGALGGMLVPAALYALFNHGGPGAHGWGVPMATDIAFALGVLALLGPRVPAPLRVFLAALAIADDIGAVLVIAIFYAGGVDGIALAAAGALLGVALAANAAGVRRPWAYAVIGVALWAAVFASGVHATVAGVLLAFAIPARTRVHGGEFLAGTRRALDRFEHTLATTPGGLAATVLRHEESQEALHRVESLCEAAQPPLHRFEYALHGVVAFGIMPLFALANAGVPLGDHIVASLTSSVTIGVVVGLVLGKPIGITALAWLSARLGLAAPPSGTSWRALHGVSWLGGIGFTMALFVAGLAFAAPEDAALLTDAKLGILLASMVAGVAGWVAVQVTTPRVPAVSGDAAGVGEPAWRAM